MSFKMFKTKLTKMGLEYEYDTKGLIILCGNKSILWRVLGSSHLDYHLLIQEIKGAIENLIESYDT